MPPLSPESAKSLMNQAARDDLSRILLMSLLGGASARAAAGVYGNIARNMRRKRERTEETGEAMPGEITFSPKSAASEPPRPGWFVPSAVLGGAGALYSGWAGVSHLMKAYRKMRTRQELEAAKQEFEDALNEEGQLKFSADLNDLANAWVRGEMDDELEKGAGVLDHVTTAVKGVPPVFYTLAALAAGLGGMGGWKMMGKNPQDEELRAYREAARRRLAARPISIVARTKKPTPPTPPSDSTTRTEQKDPNEETKTASIRKKAANLMSALRGAGKFLGTAGAGGVLGSLAMTKTPLGRGYLGSRANDLLSDPAFVDRAMTSLSDNPALMSAIYERLLPAIKRQMVARNPWMGRLAQHFA